MTSDEGSGNGFAVDARSIKVSAVLIGIGGAICLAGFAVGGYALYDAVSKWIDELEQPPSQMAMNRWAQAKVAAAAGLNAWQEHQAQQQQGQQPLPGQRRGPQAV